jgi:hypothetical protein
MTLNVVRPHRSFFSGAHAGPARSSLGTQVVPVPVLRDGDADYRLASNSRCAQVGQ